MRSFLAIGQLLDGKSRRSYLLDLEISGGCYFLTSDMIGLVMPQSAAQIGRAHV